MLIFCYAKISSFDTTKVLPKSCQLWIFVQLACFSCPGEFLNFVEKNNNTKKTNKKNKDLACFVFLTFLSWNLTLGLNSFKISIFESTKNLPFHALVFGAFLLSCVPWRVSLSFFLNLVQETLAEKLFRRKPSLLLDG